MKHGHRWLIGALAVVALAVVLTLIAIVAQDSLALNGTTYHVDADASGLNNGSSWGDAFTELQPALEAAVSGDQIWVAEGTYTPTAEHGGAGDRYRSFQLMNGVAIYGGFDPSVGHTEWEDRDWMAHPTILSGDVGIEGEPSDNSYHVFYHPEEYMELDSSAILDGFAITGGNANGGDFPQDRGGGMYNYGSSPTLTNCTFSGNSAGYAGGGMYNGSGSSPTLTDCAFSGNSVNSVPNWGGAGMGNSSGSSPVLANCAFTGNTAGSGWGGGMHSVDSSPTLNNCTFTGNSADSGGGMDNVGNSSPTLTNCVLWGDSPDEIYNYYSVGTPVVTYSDVQDGYPGETNINEDPLFVDPDNGDFHLLPGSPCIDAGSNDAPELPDYDFEGDDRVLDGDGNMTRIVDMGVDEVSIEWPYFHVYLPVALHNY